jgi:Contractile injection system tube protein
MPDSINLAKAMLQDLTPKFELTGSKEHWVTVQFNPETLKVTYSNHVDVKSGVGDQKGMANMQFIGAGLRKLSLQLWFDVTVPTLAGPSVGASLSAGPLQASVSVGLGGGDTDATRVNDVRKLTQKVAYFITPFQQMKDNQPVFIPPAVRFVWGSIQFDGYMESLEESLEFFSSEGIPLRASMSMSLSQQKLEEFTFKGAGIGLNIGIGVPGTQPLLQVSAGATLQGLVDKQGQGGNWQAVAAANGIENPRALNPGQLINVNVSGPSR